MHNYVKCFLKDANFGSPSDLFLFLRHIEFYGIKHNVKWRFLQMCVFFFFFAFSTVWKCATLAFTESGCIIMLNGFLKDANFGSLCQIFIRAYHG